MNQRVATQQVRASYETLYRESGLMGAPQLYQWIVNVMNPQPRSTLLDVACGEGWLVQGAVRRGLAAYGLDIAHAAIQRARQHAPEGRFTVGDAETLPFASASFDYVVCLGSLENMPNPWLALAEICRVTKAHGVVCVMMPNIFWLGDVLSVLFRGTDDTPFQAVERRATRHAWRNFLLAGGLTIEQEFRYNRPAVLFQQRQLKSLRKFLIRSALNLITPVNLSWSFVYLCRKARATLKRDSDYWLWEAHQSWLTCQQ
jgi:SAM-dependent methyltransferase